MKPLPPGAIASLVLGIFALISGCVPFIGVVLGTIAIIQARRAVSLLYQNTDVYQPTGIPVAGMVTGIIGMVLSILATIWMFFFFSLLGAVISAAAHAPALPVESPMLW